MIRHVLVDLSAIENEAVYGPFPGVNYVEAHKDAVRKKVALVCKNCAGGCAIRLIAKQAMISMEKKDSGTR